jgi:hypothetical protein
MGSMSIALTSVRPRRTDNIYAYSDNYLVDLKHAVIVDVEATTVIRQGRSERSRQFSTAPPSSMSMLAAARGEGLGCARLWPGGFVRLGARLPRA